MFCKIAATVEKCKSSHGKKCIGEIGHSHVLDALDDYPTMKKIDVIVLLPRSGGIAVHQETQVANCCIKIERNDHRIGAIRSSLPI